MKRVGFILLVFIFSCGTEAENSSAETIEEPAAIALAPEKDNRKWLEYPVLSKTGKNLNDFVPKGWEIFDSIAGDVNNDKQPDIAFILQYKDSALFIRTSQGGHSDTLYTRGRILAVAKRNNNGLSLAVQNNSFVPTHDGTWMLEPFETGSMSIKNRVLEINFNYFYTMGSWSVDQFSYKFREQNGRFLLIGSDVSSFMRNSHDYEEYSYNFLTKKMSIKKGNDNEPGNNTTEWKNLNAGADELPDLGNIPFLYVYEEKTPCLYETSHWENASLNGKPFLLTQKKFFDPEKPDSKQTEEYGCGSPFDWLDKEYAHDSITVYQCGNRKYISNGNMYLLTEFEMSGNELYLDNGKIKLNESTTSEDFANYFLKPVEIAERESKVNPDGDAEVRLYFKCNFDDHWIFVFKNGKLFSVKLWWLLC
ncbi:MAG: hypothetical protein ACOZCO_01660 [Bacteroidota bacterium]